MPVVNFLHSVAIARYGSAYQTGGAPNYSIRVRACKKNSQYDTIPQTPLHRGGYDPPVGRRSSNARERQLNSHTRRLATPDMTRRPHCVTQFILFLSAASCISLIFRFHVSTRKLPVNNDRKI